MQLYTMNPKWHCSAPLLYINTGNCSQPMHALALNTLQNKICNDPSAAFTLSNTEMSGKRLLMNF